MPQKSWKPPASCERDNFSPPPVPTIDDATPADIRKRTKIKIEQLKSSINQWQKSIANAEAELAEWVKLIGG